MDYNGFKILNHHRFSTKTIKSIGKGALPNKLKGSFSDERRAVQAIDAYIAGKNVKGDSDAKRDSTTRSK